MAGSVWMQVLVCESTLVFSCMRAEERYGAGGRDMGLLVSGDDVCEVGCMVSFGIFSAQETGCVWCVRDLGLRDVRKRSFRKKRIAVMEALIAHMMSFGSSGMCLMTSGILSVTCTGRS